MKRPDFSNKNYEKVLLVHVDSNGINSCCFLNSSLCSASVSAKVLWFEMWSGVKVWDVKGLILKGHIEWPICKILHAFPYKMEVQMSFLHITWKDIDWLKWLNGKMVTKVANGKFLMHFLITSRGKCISSYDMKRHW